MVRFQVQAVDRPNFLGVSRAGRFWPSAAPVEVLVYDQVDDPPDVLDKEKKSTRHSENPRRVGKASFEAMKADKRLRIINSGDPMAVETETISNLRARFDEAWESRAKAHTFELSELAARHGEILAALEHEHGMLKQEHEALKEHAAKLEAEIAELLAAKGGDAAAEETPPEETGGKPDDTKPGKRTGKRTGKSEGETA